MSEGSGSSSPLVFQGAVLAGRYRLDSVVGSGGMGAVWAATHLGVGQQVAIKLVYSNFARSPDALQRFDREAKAAAQIKSRHVPQVYDNGVLEDGTPFLAMELLHGETLFRRIHKQGPIPLAETISILDQCCKALGRAHALGIIHRDIKPDNIFLAQENDSEGYVVKVLDFGIAKFTQLGDGEHSTTRTGSLLGTPQYMSPEQARAVKNIDSRTDLYSLGVVAYTMLTGNLAFSGESLGDLLLQICAQPLPSLIGAAPWLPPAVETWFTTACARDPEHRFPTAQAFIDGLRAAAVAPQTTPYPIPTGGGMIVAGTPSQGGGVPYGNPQYGGQPYAGAPYGSTPSTTGAASLALPPRPPGARSPVAVIAVIGLLGLTIAAGVAVVVLRGHRTTAQTAPPPVASWTAPSAVEAGAVTDTKLEPLTATTPSSPASTATGPGQGHPPVPTTTNAWHPPPGTTTTTAATATAAVPATTATTPKGKIDLGY